MKRPRVLTIDDVQADAAVAFIEMRTRWAGSRVVHLPIERQERLAVNFARLRLFDKYETEFARGKITQQLQLDDSFAYASGLVDPKTEDKDALTDLDKAEIRDLVTHLPERSRFVTQRLMLDGATQREVSEELGVSQTKVFTLAERARAQLRILLKDYAP